MVEQVRGVPSPAVRPYVERYDGFRLDGLAPAVHRGLPSRYLTLIFSLGDPLDMVGMPDPRQSPGRYPTLLGGLHAAPARIGHDGRQFGIQLRVKSFGARTLFGLPAAALAGTCVEAVDVLGPRTREVVDRLHAAADWPSRFAVLDDVLAALAARRVAGASAKEPRAEVAHAWRRLVGTDGALDVGALANEVGWSRRHFGERFRDEFGLSPKVVARILRFERARRLIREAPTNLAAVAAASGYYDQAHMVRDWHDLAGCSPSLWIAEELPFVQDDQPPAGAG